MSGTPLSTIRNIGPAIEAAFLRAGVPDAETLRELGPDRAYARLLDAGERPHFIMYYVLVMALQGRPWNDCQGPEKAALRRRFDRIKAEAARRGKAPDPSGRLSRAMEAELRALGLLPAAEAGPRAE
ncbi:MAG: TfoX/Sxy family protein [Gemmobacter sp.]